MSDLLPTLTVESLGGGLNTGVPSDKIADDEWNRLLNFYPDGPGIRRRGGTRRITVDKYSPAQDGQYQELTSFHRYLSSDGIWALVVGATQSIALLDAGGQNLRVLSEVAQFTESFIPWIWAQYKDIVYGFRTGPGMVRVSVTPSERVTAPGMDAPATAPGLGDGSAGQIPAANFQGVVTCYNRRTGAESNPSPASATLAHGAGTMIRWTNIALCPPDQADARRLYRTLPNQTGAYYRVTTIEDNSTTSYANDNLLVAALGPAVSFKNGKPPANLIMGVIWRDRLFASDGTNVYWSQIGLPESFWENDALPVGPDDGFPITGLHADEDRLYIQKANAMHYLTGSDVGRFELHTLDTAHGGWSHHAMVSAGGRLYWLGWDDFYSSTGGPGVAISNPQMRRYLEKQDRDKMFLSHATVVPDKELILLTVPLSEEVDEDVNPRTTTLVYNYKTEAWSVWGIKRSASLNFLQRTFDRFDEPVLWALFNYNLYTHDDPDWPYDEASDTAIRGAASFIDCVAKGKMFVSSPAARTLLRRIKLLGDPIGAMATLKVYLNGDEETPAKSRLVDLSSIDDWRAFNLSTLGRPASSIQIEVNYSGVPELSLRGLALEMSRTIRSRRAY